MSRYIAWALEAAGALLFALGACGLAYLVHPLLAALIGGILALVAGAVIEPERRR